MERDESSAKWRLRDSEVIVDWVSRRVSVLGESGSFLEMGRS